MIDVVEERREKGRQDTKRLDWLEAHKGSWSHFLSALDYGVIVDVCHAGYLPKANEVKGETIREALDAAIAKEAEEKGGKP